MKDTLKEIAKDLIGGIAFFTLLAAMCWVCCALSGYHWE